MSCRFFTVASPEAGGDTIGAVCGGGNLYRGEYAAKLATLASLKAGVARISLYPNDYFERTAPSPARIDVALLATLRAGIEPYVMFEFRHNYDSAAPNMPDRNYPDWFSIGKAFAGRFAPGAEFLRSNGVTNGVRRWAAINEPDWRAAEDSNLTYSQYRDMLKGLADGVHASDPAGKVIPGGYLALNRDLRKPTAGTAHGYLAAVADLINVGTLAGFDLHQYYDKRYAPVEKHEFSVQRVFERAIHDSKIRRTDIEWTVTEHNVKADPEASKQGYDEQTMRRWFLTHFFDVHGLTRADGSKAPGVRLAWNIWRQSAKEFHMADADDPWAPRFAGMAYRDILAYVHDMRFTYQNPKEGVYRLAGGGKTAWVFQNLNASWSSLSGARFKVKDIPPKAAKLTVFDGYEVTNEIPVTGASMTIHTPVGRSYLILADAQ
ncbi:MAG TPA: hypothetical protein PLU30_08800 [Verrucomicrobiae bacterium]|nr:hypothetical protein [Verrucomicrobiae bacterium]